MNKVCAAAAKCVVVVVSGRPMIIPPAMLTTIDALVAAWLPGSDGEGVADDLFGNHPYTGKLPVTWPRIGLAGADQHRRQAVRPAVPLRLRAADEVDLADRSGPAQAGSDSSAPS